MLRKIVKAAIPFFLIMAITFFTLIFLSKVLIALFWYQPPLGHFNYPDE